MEPRSHNNGELRKEDISKEVSLYGWVNTNRDHGGLIFIDLRDRYGFTQIVFDPEVNKENHATSEHLRREDVLWIKGKVRARPEGMTNPALDTGEVEVLVSELKIVSKAQTPPIEVDDRIVPNEEIRLKYRYLDLRRPIMQKHLKFKHDMMKSAREFLNNNSFLEIETPLLVKATPEGARDYVVPSRVSPGKFYALPQSPQLYKQILMISGVDRYYQIARCLRDEDLRSDRQPEHAQIDLEMSFVTSKEVMDTVENMYKKVIKEVKNIDINDFEVMTYDHAMNTYGSDKPDLRFDLELYDVKDIVKDSDFQVFKGAQSVKCINPPDMSRKDIDKFIDFCIKDGAKGMAWMRVTKDGLESNIAKFFSAEIQDKLIKTTGAKEGSVLFFIADKEKMVHHVLGNLRNEVAKKLNLIKDPEELKFVWIVDFPIFAWDEDNEKWEAEHNIFSQPKSEHIELIDKDPASVRGELFDLVLNGVEIGSGAIRVSDPSLQKKLMDKIGISESEAEEKFGFLIEAYKYGAPNHGGMGLGLDRICAMLLGFNDIREVIPFPKNKNAECPMDGCPSNISEAQMKELHIKHDIVKKG